ncbi:MAG: metallophosphoesterase [Eubacterium sp.]|nr:metallophosphoesterase [Eubacterium sp.]
MVKIIIIVLLCIAIYFIWQKRELEKFNVTTYSLELGIDLTLCVISDLHCKKYGAKNERLILAVKDIKPDIICIPGDIITAYKNDDYWKKYIGRAEEAFKDELCFLKELQSIAPVYYSPGNHEERLKVTPGIRSEIFSHYLGEMKAFGITYLDNESIIIKKDGKTIEITGLSIDLGYYKKLKKVLMPKGYIRSVLGVREESADVSILLAHNPDFFENYNEFGADLILSGHTHGGLVRLPFVGAVISPSLRLFPKYDAGRFELGNATMLISKGLGTHSFNIRVNDRAEVLKVGLNNNNV